MKHTSFTFIQKKRNSVDFINYPSDSFIMIKLFVILFFLYV